ncbi:unnamed protein product [Adineta steineri]|uniref:PEBP-like protein n=1 Tax=Adineta steineri TaxID=433720 RepID=A0A818XRK4_9BILA|nr:unnamed protein product [Adineta steineri]
MTAEQSCLYCPAGSQTRLDEIYQAFFKADIIPDIIPTFIPTTYLDLQFQPLNGKPINVTLGNEISTLQTLILSGPSFYFGQEVDCLNAKYTLIMFDPDTPNPKLNILSSILHWIVHDLLPCNSTNPRAPLDLPPNTMYAQPTPLSFAPHRYTFLLCRQPPNPVYDFQLQTVGITGNTRPLFNIKQYLIKSNLTVVSGNFFLQGLNSVV